MQRVGLLVLGSLIVASCGDGGGGDGDDDDDRAAYWAERVDSFWGPAPDAATRLELFDSYWEVIGPRYPGFGVNGVDWDEVRAAYRPQVEAAESHGRFFALLSEVAWQMHDGHTNILSAEVCDTPLADRPPVYRAPGIELVSATGACATATDDDALVVFRVDPANPAGLAPGDQILGYDGVSWSEWLERIPEWRLPICGFRGSAPRADEYLQLAEVLNNAHLFDRLDVRRHGTGAVEAIPTETLLDYAGDLVCPPQLPVPGVDLPWTTAAEIAAGASPISWGVLEGTNIGYVYVYNWMPGTDVGPEFLAAVTAVQDADGIIIDQRFNGGGATLWHDGAALLFDQDHEDIWCSASRSDTLPEPTELWIHSCRGLAADPETVFDRPIAVLVGPNAASAGDLFPLEMSWHPRVRRFGRLTHGSFARASMLWDRDPWLDDLWARYTKDVFVDGAGRVLQGSAYEPDVEVWLTADDTAEGVDSVVEAARAWIAQSSGG